MRRKPLPLVLMALVLFVALLAGCQRRAVPLVDTLVPEDEATAAMQEAEDNTEGMQEEPQETAASPVETPTEEVQPTAPTEPSPTEAPSATTEPATTEPAATEPAPTNTTAPTAAPTTAASGQTVEHVVQPGENLFRISLRYNSTVDAVARANNITNPALIYVGQKLKVPCGTGSTTPPTTPGQSCSVTYVVKPGDNLFRIALRYNYSQYYLAQVNGISNPALIRVGQTICIP